MTDETPKTISDAEEARIQRLITSDPDAPEITEAQMAEAKPFSEAFPEAAEEMRRKTGGRPRSEHPKVPISIRLDSDLVAELKASGPGWQSRVNAMLRRAVLADG
ncbi:MAG: BrnA antitoxin family protein [Silicimonas sp.]|nr:BrnA antitoxin family protein [Silicimonas sp.]